MNKEIIKQYKAEFDHWLDGGSVLSINCLSTIEWSEVDSDRHWDITQSGEYVPKFVINDEYVEFRKALAEGKTIQYRYKGNPESYDWMQFSNKDYSNYLFEDKYIYRIKPDKLKFKVGDWVRNKNSGILSKLLETSDYDKGYFKTTNDSPNGYLTQISHNTFELWTPQSNEWVCSIKDTNLFEVYKYKHYTNPRPCQPFIGTLPEELQ